MSRSVIILLIVLVFCGVGVVSAYAQGEPPPDMPPMPDRLAPPPTVYPPTQADQGAQVYYLVCMACHGDRGQGLTKEWRGALDLPDQDCWQSRCHASNHPPGGFVFPKVVPAVASPGMVARFKTALDLHDFIKARMPWQAPGSLKDDEYWQLTAFLLRTNGIDPGNEPLDAQRAARTPMLAALVTASESQDDRQSLWLGSAIAVGALALIFFLLKKRTFLV